LLSSVQRLASSSGWHLMGGIIPGFAVGTQG
jgi:hypothetical protein